MHQQHIQDLYNSCVSKIDYNFNFGYKEYSTQDKQKMCEYFQNKISDVQNQVIKQNICYMSSGITTFLGTLFYIYGNRIGLVLPTKSSLVARVKNIDQKMQIIDKCDLTKNYQKLKQIQILVVQSHNIEQQAVQICKKFNILLYVIENQYVAKQTCLNYYHKYPNIVMVQKIGIQFQDHFNFQYALTIIPSLELAEIYEKYTANTFKIISNNIGIVLTKGYFNQEGIRCRNLLKKIFINNFRLLSQFFNKKGMQYELIQIYLVVTRFDNKYAQILKEYMKNKQQFCGIYAQNDKVPVLNLVLMQSNQIKKLIQNMKVEAKL